MDHGEGEAFIFCSLYITKKEGGVRANGRYFLCTGFGGGFFSHWILKQLSDLLFIFQKKKIIGVGE